MNTNKDFDDCLGDVQNLNTTLLWCIYKRCRVFQNKDLLKGSFLGWGVRILLFVNSVYYLTGEVFS